MRQIRLLTLSLAAVVAVLAWSLPAGAQQRAATVNVTAGKPSEFGFTLSAKSVKHGAVTFAVTNSGILPHDFKVCTAKTTAPVTACAGKKTAQIVPGKTAKLVITFTAPGSYAFLCTVSGHAAAGMKGLIKVT